MEPASHTELAYFETDYPIKVEKSHRGVVNSSHLDTTGSNSIADVEITLKQKPRGSKGVWLPLVAGERIRVSDKKAGKNLRVLVASRRRDLDLDHLVIVCYEKKAASSKKHASDWTLSPSVDYVELKRTTQSPTPAGFVQVVEVDIKVLVMYRTVKFHLTIPSFAASTAPLVVESAEFITYNSGSEDTPTLKVASSEMENSPPVAAVEVPVDMALSPVPYPGSTSPIDPDTSSVSPSQPQQNQQHCDVQTHDLFDPMMSDDWSVMRQNLSVDGILRAQQFFQLSDIRLKTDIRDITSAISIISQLNGRSYKWRRQGNNNAGEVSSSASTSTTEQVDDDTRGQRCLVFIAQELERVVPEVIHQSSKGGFLVVAYAELVPILIEALKFHMQRQKDVEILAHEMELTSEQFLDLQRGAVSSLRAATENIRLLPAERPSKRPVSPKSDTSIEMSTLKSNETKRKPIWTLDGNDHEKNQKKKPSKPASCYDCSPWNLLLVGLSLLLVGSAIFLGVFFGLRPPNASESLPSAPSNTSAAPVSFVTTNYQVGDPGFEDPAAQIWVGNQTFYAYGSQTKRSALSRFARVDNANQYFDAGRYAVYVYQDPNVAELPQFAPVGLFQPVNIAFVLRRLRELYAARNSTASPSTNESPPLEPPVTPNSSKGPVSPPVAAPMRSSVTNSSNPPISPNGTAPSAPPTNSTGTANSVGSSAPSLGPRETLLINISVWMNRDYADDPSIRDAAWQPQDVFIVLRISYDSGRETVVRQSLDARVANGWRRYTMLSSISVTQGLPTPNRVFISFRSSLPGYVFFDAVTVDYRLIVQNS